LKQNIKETRNIWRWQNENNKRRNSPKSKRARK